MNLDALSIAIIGLIAYHLGFFKIGKAWSKLKQAKLERKLKEQQAKAAAAK